MLTVSKQVVHCVKAKQLVKSAGRVLFYLLETASAKLHPRYSGHLLLQFVLLVQFLAVRTVKLKLSARHVGRALLSILEIAIVQHLQLS